MAAEIELQVVNGEEEFAGWETVRVLGEGNGEYTNEVVSSKYTVMNFLPRTFLLQFRRVGNIYFSFIVLVMIMGSYTKLFQSPQAPWGNLSILMVIFGLNMTNEGLDDMSRVRKDRETNTQVVDVYDLESKSFVKKSWGEIGRGDLIRLSKGCVCPVDMLLVHVSDVDVEGCCYIQTANVDGETYLKKRECKKEFTEGIKKGDVDWLIDRRIRVEPPSHSFSSFKCVVDDGIETTSDHIILRGSELRNTDWIWGVALYTGNETKMLMSQGTRQIKQSKVDKLANKVIVSVLIILAILLLVSVLVVTFAYASTSTLWYLDFTPEADGSVLPAWLALLLTYLVLYRQILPILLYAVQEGMNVIQTKYIGWDLNMYDEDTGKFASCNTTSLAQEIGQVNWIFSDKTGTLTRNEMRLVACTVEGETYGRYLCKDLEALAEETCGVLQSSRICFSDLLDALEQRDENVEAFMRALSLCHTVLVERDHGHKDTTRMLRRRSLSSSVVESTAYNLLGTKSTLGVVGEHDSYQPKEEEKPPGYNAESPDEEALVLGAAALGYKFSFTENMSTLGIEVRHPYKIDEDIELPRHPTHVERWEVLAINPFTSDRKRMSVLYRDPRTKRIKLYVKGADNQMLAIASRETTDFEGLKATLQTFAEHGLRTLVVGEREVSEEEFNAWNKRHDEACGCTDKGRKAKLDAVACEIEKDVKVLGTTAVEDRLQDGVPQTISILRAAKINIWLITGDKVETAINIGRSAELLTQNSDVLMLTAKELALGEDFVSAQGDLLNVIYQMIEEHPAEDEDAGDGNFSGFFDRVLRNRFKKTERKSKRVKANPDLALVVDGDTLHYIFKDHEELQAAFLKLSKVCGVVIACRASPGQKAQLVKAVQDNTFPTPTTLAIGDGANDVPMIEAGSVGVGISGKEGTHAANAADFTISQFKFLAPLLLVHGRSGYIRVAKAISLTFYANLLFTFVSFYYNFVCRFSGQPAFSNIQYVLFQMFIAVPVFALGFTDRDFRYMYDALKDPRCYDVGRLNRILHPAFVDFQILRGAAHGAFAFLLVFWNDYDGTYLALSGSLYIVVTVVLTVRQGLSAASLNILIALSLVFNVVMVILLVFIVNAIKQKGENMFNLSQWGRYYWNQLIATIFLVSLMDYLVPIFYMQFKKLL
uniref:Phospholipid-transporting ATPase n=1 Tax=Mucochytrium quahogii TaxID=96639 RepID=A0A7S2WIZ1_9STRA